MVASEDLTDEESQVPQIEEEMEEEGIVPEIVQSGEVPWSLDGLLEATMEMNRLHVAPHDDRDRTRRGPVIQDDSDEIVRYFFDPEVMDNQIGLWLSLRLQQQGLDATTTFCIGLWLSRRLREQGLDTTTTFCHLWRFMEIRLFIGENVGRLREDGFARDDPTDPERAEISLAVLEVLATAPFDGVRTRGAEREPVRTFRYESVVEAARLRKRKDMTFPFVTEFG